MKEEVSRFLTMPPRPSNRNGMHEMFTIKNTVDEKKVINSYFSCNKERFHNNYLIHGIYISKPKMEKSNFFLKAFREIINPNKNNFAFLQEVFEKIYSICQEYQLYRNPDKLKFSKILDEQIINKSNICNDSDSYNNRTKLLIEKFITVDYGYDKVKDDKSRNIGLEFGFLNQSGKLVPVIIFQWLFAKNVHRKFFVGLNSEENILYEKRGDSYYPITMEDLERSIEQVVFKILYKRFSKLFAQDMIGERSFFKLSKELKKDYVTQYKMYYY